MKRTVDVDALAAPRSVPRSALPLAIESVETHRVENRQAHHTDKYDDPKLIVRRGQNFLLTLSTRDTLPGR